MFPGISTGGGGLSDSSSQASSASGRLDVSGGVSNAGINFGASKESTIANAAVVAGVVVVALLLVLRGAR